MTDLLTQLRSYGEQIETTTGLVKTPHVPPITERQVRRRPAWVYALVAAILVLLFGWVAILLRNSAEEAPPVTQPTPPSGANGWIAISTSAPLAPGDIYITREGESPRRIIGSEGDGLEQNCPVFSPDGSKLAYLESDWDLGVHKVVIGEFDGDFEPLLSFNTTGPRFGCITWSPDSTRVAYMAYPDGAAGTPFQRLQVGTLEGNEMTLFEGTNGHFDLEWSPDGSSIAVLGPPGGVSTGEQKVWVVPVDGTDARTVFESGEPSVVDPGLIYFLSVTWSPDSSQLAMLGQRRVEGYVQVIGVEEGTQHEFPAGGVADFDEVAWSPDGSKLAWVDQGLHRVIVADPDGNNPVTLAVYEHGGEVYLPPYWVAPIWSADGRRILIPMGTNPDERGFVLVALSLDPEVEPVLITELDGIGGSDSVSWQVER